METPISFIHVSSLTVQAYRDLVYLPVTSAFWRIYHSFGWGLRHQRGGFSFCRSRPVRFPRVKIGLQRGILYSRERRPEARQAIRAGCNQALLRRSRLLDTAFTVDLYSCSVDRLQQALALEACCTDDVSVLVFDVQPNSVSMADYIVSATFGMW